MGFICLKRVKIEDFWWDFHGNWLEIIGFWQNFRFKSVNLTFPLDLTPWKRQRKTAIQHTRTHRPRYQLRVPKSSIPLDSINTSLLENWAHLQSQGWKKKWESSLYWWIVNWAELQTNWKYFKLGIESKSCNGMIVVSFEKACSTIQLPFTRRVPFISRHWMRVPRVQSEMERICKQGNQRDKSSKVFQTENEGIDQKFKNLTHFLPTTNSHNWTMEWRSWTNWSSRKVSKQRWCWKRRRRNRKGWLERSRYPEKW